MGHQIPGANTFPVDFTIPDDIDARNAGNIDVPIEALADRTQFLKQHMGVLKSQIFLANGTWVAPEGCTMALLVGFGGGGGGAAGNNGSDGISTDARPGGGGGGGSWEITRFATGIIPGDTYNITIGAGGAGGAAGSTDNGTNGSQTQFSGPGLPFTYKFNGAGGGLYGTASTGIAPNVWGLGGAPVGRVAVAPAPHAGLPNFVHLFNLQTPGHGGMGSGPYDPYLGQYGVPSVQGGFGGPSGAPGVDSANPRPGGGPGGGGGGGPRGPGGSGGSGGDANDAGANGVGTDGVSANNNTGAGGGGGGAAGGGSVQGVTDGGGGGNGGSGKLIVIWLEHSGI